MTVRARWALPTLLAGLLVAGCGSSVEGVDEPPIQVTTLPVPSPVAAPAAPTTVGDAPPASSSRGLVLDIARIGASSTLVPLGLNPDRTVATPPVGRPGQAGYYENGPLPGEPGPAVVLGHINGGGRPGVFSRLAELHAGDRVTVSRDGRPLTFTVYRTEQVSKSAFPTARVYGDTPGPELRLLSCGGALDRSAHRYLGQVIVYATLSG